MIARPYAVACGALLAGMLAAAALVTFYLGAKSVPLTLLLFFIPAAAAVFGLMGLLVLAMVRRPVNRRLPRTAEASIAFLGLAYTTVLFSFWFGRSLGLQSIRLTLLFAILGGSMIVLGNAAGKLPPNHPLGFRSVWALADEEVWDKTQRFGGWVLVIAGFVIVDAALMFDLAIVNLVMLAATCSSSILITAASWRFAQQKRKAREEEWQRLSG